MGILKSLINFLIPSMQAWNLYDEVWVTEKCLKHDSTLGNLSSLAATNEIAVDFTGLYNPNSVTYAYMLTDLPESLPLNWKTSLRSYCQGDTRLSFINLCIPTEINWNSSAMKNRMNVLSSVSKDVKKSTANTSVFHNYVHIQEAERQKYLESSVSYLTEATKIRDRGFIRSSMLLLISGSRGDQFDSSVHDIEKQASDSHLGLTLQRVLYNVPSVISVYSPFANSREDTETFGSLPFQVLSDEVLARYNVFTQGTVGIHGAYVGTDVFSSYPVYKRFKEDRTAAENILIAAETGGGKSYLMKLILLQLLAQGFRGTIMDVEGKEYLSLHSLLNHHSKACVVNMGVGSGCYYDPVAIPKLTGDPDIDDVALTMSKDYTVQLLLLLLGDLVSENSWYAILVDKAVSTTYINAGVSLNDKSTWFLSKSLTLFSVYKTLKLLKDTYLLDLPEVHNCFVKMEAQLSSYFEPDGANGLMFANQIQIDAIAYSDLVICSFGMAGRADNSVSKVQMALMQLSAAMLSYQRSIYSFNEGLLNFKVWEEFQRWGAFEGSDKTINTALTGGRKLGDVNFIISNKVSDLLANDRFNILQTVQSSFIGKIPDEEVRNKLLERRGLLAFKDALMHISEDAKEKEDLSSLKNKKNGKNKSDSHKIHQSKYCKAFLCDLDKTYFTVLKVSLPANVSNTPLFYTAPIDKSKKKDSNTEPAEKEFQPLDIQTKISAADFDASDVSDVVSIDIENDTDPEIKTLIENATSPFESLDDDLNLDLDMDIEV